MAEWAERETTAQIASLTAAWISDPDEEPGQAEVLVLGPSGMLPATQGESRFWGVDLLIPVGFRVDPELSEPAVRRVVGAGPGELVVLDDQGPERIPREAFRPLSRAAIRLACAATAPDDRKEAVGHELSTRSTLSPDPGGVLPVIRRISLGPVRRSGRVPGGTGRRPDVRLRAEIARFLEGLLTAGKPHIAFGFVLHLLYLIGLGERTAGQGSNHRVDRIAEPFRDLKSPLRNAGALCAWLCRDIRGVAEPPELSDILQLLNSGSWVPQMVLSHPMLGAMDYAEQPGLEPFEFEARVARELDTMSDHAIRHWLKHGRGPVGTIGDRLVPFPTRDLEGSLSELERRPRLAGATLLISRLEGALSLPPRRLDRSAMQTDGYSDLTTRGSPEQILPIQFALEDEEFLRRFAERELLYFHRETPREPAVEEIVLLLDQGVRTWGDVRLVLAGAAMALARQAVRRRIAIRLATTGNGGETVNLVGQGPDELAELLEASDLSPHPGRILSRLLQSHVGAPGDVVLLTHPRSLGEPDVADAARLLAGNAGTRLFVVSVDSGGQVELAELRRGWPVVLGRSRVDLGVLTNPMLSAAPAVGRGHERPWQGDLEPIPFPFRTGILDRVSTAQSNDWQHLDFDEAGERILVAGNRGLLTAFRIDGIDAETLPRPIVGGEVMSPVWMVMGVAGGFVVVCHHPRLPVFAHYDSSNRTCTIHWRKIRSPGLQYYADLHTIVTFPSDHRRTYEAFDLSEIGSTAQGTSRAIRADERARAGILPYPMPAADLSTSSSEPWDDLSCEAVKLDARTGTLRYRLGSSALRSLTPHADGCPSLKGAEIARWCQGGDVLAVRVQKGPNAGILFVSISRGEVQGEFWRSGDRPADSSFALSRDGRRFARRLNDQQVEVREVPGDRPALFVTPREDLWIHFASLGRSCLLVREFDLAGPRRARTWCLIRWDRGRLEVDHHDPGRTFRDLGGVVAESRSLTSTQSGSYQDPGRFLQVVEHGALRILIDQYNHLVVLGRDGELISMFYVSGHEFAAWTPDGSRLGSSRLIGGESTPHAAERIARVLRSAEQEGRRGP